MVALLVMLLLVVALLLSLLMLPVLQVALLVLLLMLLLVVVVVISRGDGKQWIGLDASCWKDGSHPAVASCCSLCGGRKGAGAAAEVVA